MGKVDENKHQKMDALFQSAYDLFLNQGIEKTSISDIAKKAGVAKGTFYLYFADKYEIRDRLIARTASRLFQRAHKALETADIPEFEDKIIFIVDYVLNAMQKNKLILRFISKNLSWGISDRLSPIICRMMRVKFLHILVISFWIIRQSNFVRRKLCCF